MCITVSINKLNYIQKTKIYKYCIHKSQSKNACGSIYLLCYYILFLVNCKTNISMK